MNYVPHSIKMSHFAVRLLAVKWYISLPCEIRDQNFIFICCQFN